MVSRPFLLVNNLLSGVGEIGNMGFTRVGLVTADKYVRLRLFAPAFEHFHIFLRIKSTYIEEILNRSAIIITNQNRTKSIDAVSVFTFDYF